MEVIPPTTAGIRELHSSPAPLKPGGRRLDSTQGVAVDRLAMQPTSPPRALSGLAGGITPLKTGDPKPANSLDLGRFTDGKGKSYDLFVEFVDRNGNVVPPPSGDFQGALRNTQFHSTGLTCHSAVQKLLHALEHQNGDALPHYITPTAVGSFGGPGNLPSSISRDENIDGQYAGDHLSEFEGMRIKTTGDIIDTLQDAITLAYKNISKSAAAPSRPRMRVRARPVSARPQSDTPEPTPLRIRPASQPQLPPRIPPPIAANPPSPRTDVPMPPRRTPSPPHQTRSSSTDMVIHKPLPPPSRSVSPATTVGSYSPPPLSPPVSPRPRQQDRSRSNTPTRGVEAAAAPAVARPMARAASAPSSTLAALTPPSTRSLSSSPRIVTPSVGSSSRDDSVVSAFRAVHFTRDPSSPPSNPLSEEAQAAALRRVATLQTHLEPPRDPAGSPSPIHATSRSPSTTATRRPSPASDRSASPVSSPRRRTRSRHSGAVRLGGNGGGQTVVKADRTGVVSWERAASAARARASAASTEEASPVAAPLTLAAAPPVSAASRGVAPSGRSGRPFSMSGVAGAIAALVQ